jgi:prepilin-type N-terminal cleavage/methylation domain-containing protein
MGQRSAEGFSLIELMVAVAIVAVLAAVATVAYSRHINRSRVVEARAFMAKIQARMEAYLQQHGTYFDVSNNGAGAAGDEGLYYPALVPGSEPLAKPWNAPPAGWARIGARPESGHSHFEYLVRASYGPNHALYGQAAALGLQAPGAGATPAPWYYIVARGDLDDDSDGTCGTPAEGKCTFFTSTSAAGEIIVRNEGE